MMPKCAMGRTNSQMANAARIQATRQSNRPMAAPSRIGVSDINTAVAVVAMGAVIGAVHLYYQGEIDALFADINSTVQSFADLLGD